MNHHTLSESDADRRSQIRVSVTCPLLVSTLTAPCEQGNLWNTRDRLDHLIAYTQVLDRSRAGTSSSE